MSDQLRSDDTSTLHSAACAADRIGIKICHGIGNEAPELITRVETMRASLRTMLDHADRAVKASKRLRVSDDHEHRNHMREIAKAAGMIEAVRKRAS